MLSLQSPLIKLYGVLIVWSLLGFVLGRILPPKFPSQMAKILYWVGIPISIIAFMRKANLSGYVIVAPLTAWIAIAVGAGFAWIWIEMGLSDERIRNLSLGLKTLGTEEAISESPSQLTQRSNWSRPTQGSFLMAMMVGNTSYLGFPVILSLVGPKYFAWAVLYNTLGTSPALHGLGYAVASHFGWKAIHRNNSGTQREGAIVTLMKNPALWSFGVGFLIQNWTLPPAIDNSLKTSAWTVVTLSLILIGMQLSQLKSLNKLGQASTCLAIKMVFVPLVVGTGLMFFGITGPDRLVIVLQMAMPPSIATAVYAEAYGLDRELAVTTVAFGSITLLFTLPLWLWLFEAL